MKKFLLKILILFFIVTLFSIQFLYPKDKKYNETEVISAFLYNITKFIKWDKNKKNILIYIFCNKNKQKYFDRLKDKKVNELTIIVKYAEYVTKVSNADIVYIDKSYQKINKPSIGKIVSTLKNSKIFTASNIKDFAKSSGVLEFYKSKNYIRFKINIKNLKRTGVVLSSEVLELAKIVE